jgi:RNAse (barnase) inhibitor barstar
MERMTKQLADARQCGVYHLVRKPEELERTAKEAGLAVFRIDIGHTKSKKDFLAQVARALQFPDWFGENWDALNDCLTDLDWLSTETGYVLILENSEHFGARHPQEFEKAIAVFAAAAEYWKSQKRPFWAFIEASSKWDSGLSKWPG